MNDIGISNLYGDILPNFIAEATTWYEMWKDKETDESLDVNYLDSVAEATLFYPSVAEAIKIGATLPTTTCTIMLLQFTTTHQDVE